MILDRTRQFAPESPATLSDRDFPAMALLGEPANEQRDIVDPFASADWPAQRAQILTRIAEARAAGLAEAELARAEYARAEYARAELARAELARAESSPTDFDEPDTLSRWPRPSASWWLRSGLAAAGIVLAVSLLISIAAGPSPRPNLDRHAGRDGLGTAPGGERTIGTPLLLGTPSTTVGNNMPLPAKKPMHTPAPAPGGAGGSDDPRPRDLNREPSQPLYAGPFPSDLLEQPTPRNFFGSQQP